MRRAVLPVFANQDGPETVHLVQRLTIAGSMLPFTSVMKRLPVHTQALEKILVPVIKGSQVMGTDALKLTIAKMTGPTQASGVVATKMANAPKQDPERTRVPATLVSAAMARSVLKSMLV